MARWEMAQASDASVVGEAKIEGLLADGWEPYAVAAVGGHGTTVHYFRRKVALDRQT